jgi:hypothetical protein
MDENSYPTSCPNHACTGMEGLEVMLGERSEEDESKSSRNPSKVGYA